TSYDISENLCAKLHCFSFDILIFSLTSMFVTSFTNDVRQIHNMIFMSLRIMMRAPLMVIGSIIMSFIINFKISLIFLLTVPLLVSFLYWVLLKGGKLFSLVQEKVDNVNRVIQENIA